MTFLSSLENQFEQNQSPQQQQQQEQGNNELNISSSEFFGFQQTEEDSLMECDNHQNLQLNNLNQLGELNKESQAQQLPSEYLEATIGFDNFQADNYQDTNNNLSCYQHKQIQLFPCFQSQFSVGPYNNHGIYKEDTKNLLNFASQPSWQSQLQPAFLQGQNLKQVNYFKNYPYASSIDIKVEANSDQSFEYYQQQSTTDNNNQQQHLYSTHQILDIPSQTYPKPSLNYYQIFLELQKKQQQQHEDDIQDINKQQSCSSSIQFSQCPPTEISSSSSLAISKKETANNHDDDPETPSESSSTDQQQLKKQLTIHQANKKNVVKNIMSAFKNFILDPAAHGYDPSELKIVLELYNKTKNISDNQIKEMTAKFKRYITSKNFNHYTVKLLIKHTNYSPVFKYFLSGPVHGWISSSKVADVQSHEIMVNFLLDCFEDISLIDLLKRHEKKRPHFN